MTIVTVTLGTFGSGRNFKPPTINITRNNVREPLEIPTLPDLRRPFVFYTPADLLPELKSRVRQQVSFYKVFYPPPGQTSD